MRGTCGKLKLLQPTHLTQIPPNTCLKEKNCVSENRNCENCDSENPICVVLFYREPVLISPLNLNMYHTIFRHKET